MNWIALTSPEQIGTIKALSSQKNLVIFKHSTRCSISSVAKSRLERSTPPPATDFYFLDLLKHREVSDMIAEQFNVYHESPQVLVIKNGECIYDESHNAIMMEEIEDLLNSN